MPDLLSDTDLAALRDTRYTMLAQMYQRAIDELLVCRGTLDLSLTHRDVLLDLYDEGLITKVECRRRGDMDPAEFHELLAERRRNRRA